MINNILLRRNVKIIYAYSCLSSFVLTRGVFLLYLGYSGLNIIQIAFYQAIYSISTSIFEIPTGYIGDKFGKKKSLLIGMFLLSVHTILMLINSKVILFWVLGCVEALAYAFISGSDSALLYEILEQLGKKEQYLKINTKLLSAKSIITGIALLLGAFLADYSWNYVYILTTIIFSLSTFFLCFISEDNKNIKIKHSQKGSSFLKIASYKVVRNNVVYPMLSVFIIFLFISSVCDGFFMCYYNFNQIILEKLSVSIKTIGIFFSVLYLINSIAYLSINLITKIFNRKQIFIICLFIESILFFVLSTLQSQIFIILISIVICFFPEIMFAVSDSIIQQYIKNEYRATILSIVSLMRSLASGILYIILGEIFEIISLGKVFMLIGCLLTIVGGIAIIFLRKVNAKSNILECNHK